MSNLKNISQIANEMKNLQKMLPQLRSINTPQTKYFLQHSAEIAQINKTYSQLYRIMKPLAEMYPQLEKINSCFQDPPAPVSTNDDDNSEQTQDELCIAVQKYVDNIREYGLIQAQTIDEPPSQDLFFDLTYHAFISSPNELLKWLNAFYEILLKCINAADSKTISGLLNICTIFQIISSIVDLLKIFM